METEKICLTKYSRFVKKEDKTAIIGIFKGPKFWSEKMRCSRKKIVKGLHHTVYQTSGNFFTNNG